MAGQLSAGLLQRPAPVCESCRKRWVLGWVGEDWAPGEQRAAEGCDTQGQEMLLAAACKSGRLQLGNLFLLPVPGMFGSKVAVFFHIKMFGFILRGGSKSHAAHNAFLVFWRLFIAAFDF